MVLKSRVPRTGSGAASDTGAEDTVLEEAAGVAAKIVSFILNLTWKTGKYDGVFGYLLWSWLVPGGGEEGIGTAAFQLFPRITSCTIQPHGKAYCAFFEIAIVDVVLHCRHLRKCMNL